MMPSKTISTCVAAGVALSLLIPLVSGASAQAVPQGACEIPGGRWCWPIQPTTYGQPCECTTADGQVVGGITR